MSVRARGCRGREMGTAAATKGVRGARATPWAAALEKGVEGWSSFTETGSGEDIRTEDGSREVVDSARVRAGAAAASAGAPAAEGPVAARSGGDGKSADAKSRRRHRRRGRERRRRQGPERRRRRRPSPREPCQGSNNPAGKRPAPGSGLEACTAATSSPQAGHELTAGGDRRPRGRAHAQYDARRHRTRQADGRSRSRPKKRRTTSGEPETTALTDGVATRMKRRRQHQGDTPPPNPVLGTHPLLVARRRRHVGFGTARRLIKNRRGSRRAEEAAQEASRAQAAVARGQVGQLRRAAPAAQRGLHRRALRAD